jgi:hypothetical protein
MSGEIDLISDGDGIAVIGDPTAVDLFLRSEGLPSKDLGISRLRGALGTGGAVAQAGSQIAENSGRWVKLTKESAEVFKKSSMMKGTTDASSRAIAMDGNKTAHILEILTKPGTALSNPALLTGAAGLMSQMAMQQAMEEITDYLVAIDEKVDDILRAQKDAVLSQMVGVGFELDEAMGLREARGRVDEVTWSKVQSSASTLSNTQAYALSQLEAIAQKLEEKAKLGDVAESIEKADPKVREWLAVLARCFQLRDAFSILELDRVLDDSPNELEAHRVGLKAARQRRLDTIRSCTDALLARMDAAAEHANSKVLLHPSTAPAVVQASDSVRSAVQGFHKPLGIESGRDGLEARRWVEAASERVDGVKRSSVETFDRAKSVTGKLAGTLAERAARLRRGDAEE